MHVYAHACRATQGARSYQEDMAAFLVVADADAAPGAATPTTPRQLVAVLADGMGGHVGGNVASQLVCEGFLDSFGRADSDLAVADRLAAALESCNHGLAAKVESQPMYSGMGSTVIGAVFGPEGVEWVSVGDSPMYLYRRGEIALLNADHSLAPELDLLAEAGHITRHEALNDPRRHMLRSAVTGEDIELIDQSVRPTPLFPGDYVILASDGLQTLENDEIARIITAWAESGPEAVATALIGAVENMRKPHQDNATVVVVRPLPADPA